MKQIGFTLMLFVIVLSPLAAACQAMPDNPAPAEQPSASQSTQQPNAPLAPQAPLGAWRRIQRLAHGEPITVTSTLGPPLGCRFAGATDDTLFCDAPGSPDGTGYRFERATVISVECQQQQRNWHPEWITAMVVGGVLTGFAAVRGTDAGRAAGLGAIGAAVVGGVGAPMAFLGSDPGGVTVVYPMNGFRFHGRRLRGPHPRFMLPVRR